MGDAQENAANADRMCSDGFADLEMMKLFDDYPQVA